ncbi:MAG: SDR family oxidoreductase [Nevskia sp.]|nr:SDR family oxidoreductase [Nevskia sp.]
MFRLDGKVALVSGAARGIGAAIVRAMADEGASIVIGDVLDREGKALAAKIGAAARYVHLDVTRPADWASAVDTAIQAFGRLNVLVNNTGTSSHGLIEQYGQSDWDKTMAINLSGAFNGIKAAVAALRSAGGGSIVNISSTAGLLGYTAFPAYLVETFGLRNLTTAAAFELAQDGIRVNSVHPGSIGTPRVVSRQAGEERRRTGEPNELGHLVVFLASDESSSSTGREFMLDGRRSAGAVGRDFEYERTAA